MKSGTVVPLRKGQAGTVAALDVFRVAAAVLVVAIHTSPLTTYWALGDFWFTRVLARVAVPFFLMVSGYFLARNNWRTVWTVWKKTALLYGLCVLLYLPLNAYAGQLDGDFFRRIFTDGAFYHLWYFPGLLLGVPIAWALSRMGLRVALPLAGLLYLIGLGGDSYYDLISRIPIDMFFIVCGILVFVTGAVMFSRKLMPEEYMEKGRK